MKKKKYRYIYYVVYSVGALNGLGGSEIFCDMNISSFDDVLELRPAIAKNNGFNEEQIVILNWKLLRKERL